MCGGYPKASKLEASTVGRELLGSACEPEAGRHQAVGLDADDAVRCRYPTRPPASGAATELVPSPR